MANWRWPCRGPAGCPPGRPGIIPFATKLQAVVSRSRGTDGAAVAAQKVAAQKVGCAEGGGVGGLLQPISPCGHQKTHPHQVGMGWGRTSINDCYEEWRFGGHLLKASEHNEVRSNNCWWVGESGELSVTSESCRASSREVKASAASHHICP